jgi:maltose/moltooligosaccharide transporter
MNVGMLGINFGWGLQMANMSAIYEYLGAKPSQIPILWLAAPLTGLLIQPIIGYMSDHTWSRFGRRKPYFLVGGILSFLALIFMPLSIGIWMAALMLWLLDMSVNVCMGPFRALIPDVLPEGQKTKGFLIQAIAIAMGTVTASALPWILSHLFHLTAVASGQHAIPEVVKFSFWIGACVFLLSILWTFFTTKEYPPEKSAIKRNHEAKSKSILHTLAEIFSDLKSMPKKMITLSWVMTFSWMGLFCMYLYFPIAVANQVFNAKPGMVQYLAGQEWAGVCFAAYAVFFLLTSFILPFIAGKVSRRTIYGVSLAFGGIALTSILFVHTQYTLLWIMLGVGIAYAAMQSMPYAILSEVVPSEKMGVYMGIFNLFIVIPEIVIAVGMGWVMAHLLHDNREYAVVAGGLFMLLAAFLTILVKPTKRAPH